MIQLLVWALACWGLTSILTRGRIFQAPRARLRPGTFLGDLARCDQCMGLWVGLGLSLWPGLGISRQAQYVVTLFVQVPVASWDPPAIVRAAVDGLGSSALCAAAGALTDWCKAAAVAAALGGRRE
jgi:hypothetical protein